jgi:hypothetical protein
MIWRCCGCHHRLAYLRFKRMALVIGISTFQAYGFSNAHVTQCPTAQADAGVNSAALCRTRTHGAIVRTVASGTSII